MQIAALTVSVETFLHAMEIVSIVVGGLSVAYRIGKTHSAIAAAIKNQNQASERQANEISDLKIEIKKLNDVLTALAVQESRLDMHEKWIDELRHGIGLVVTKRPG